MSIQMIQFLTCLVVAGLIATIYFCLVGAKNRMTAPNFYLRSKAQRRKDRQDQTEQDKYNQMILGAIDLEKAYAFVHKAAPSNDGYLDKFNASKTARKQKPSSSATPMVKSKRRRK